MKTANGFINKKQLTARLTQQTGSVIVLFVISLLALIIMASLALDGGHLLLNKGRLQNLVDAAALHAAKEINQGATQAEASIAAKALLLINLGHIDQSELARAIDFGEVDDTSTAVLTIEYAEFPDPFLPDEPADEKPYVKVSLTQLTLDNFLANVFDFNKRISATALAGPSTAIKNCFTNLVPMTVCGEKGKDNFGLTLNKLYVLKASSKPTDAIGPGNYQLIKLDSDGKDAVRTALAGEKNETPICFSKGEGNESVPTETGVAAGPVTQGLNTRMGTWKGAGVNSIDHPRDENICQGITIDLDDEGNISEEESEKAYRALSYDTDNKNSELGNRACPTLPEKTLSGDIRYAEEGIGRRILNVVISDCDEKINGSNNLDFLGAGCFFLTQSVRAKRARDIMWLVSFFTSVPGGGKASLEPVDEPGPYKMVLYHAPGSKDS